MVSSRIYKYLKRRETEMSESLVRLRRLKLLPVLLTAFWAAACVPSVETKQAKIYQDYLDSTRGQATAKVVPVIRSEWKFELAKSSDVENPSPEKVREICPKSIQFSDAEIRDIFSQTGRYKVMVFSKALKSSSATAGEIDESGFSAVKDASYEIQRSSVIRLVFRDDKLVHSRVWPSLESSRFTEGVIRKRY
jgi:hypothetical protein